MSERMSAEELARLLALPDDHPDRVRAVGRPELEAMRRMLEGFERQPASGADVEAESARSELRRRLERAGVLAPPGSPQLSRRLVRAEPGRRGAFGWFGLPVARFGLAFAGALIVAGAAWWSLGGPRHEDVMRGGIEPGAFRVTDVRRLAGELSLDWSVAPGADEYRVVFLGPDLSEVARLEGLHGTRLVLSPERPPAGLVSGGTTSIEVVALRHGDPIATTPARSIRLP